MPDPFRLRAGRSGVSPSRRPAVGIDIDNASAKVQLDTLTLSKLPGTVETSLANPAPEPSAFNKCGSNLLEDYDHLSPTWHERHLAASVFWLNGFGAPDNQLVHRARRALAG